MRIRKPLTATILYLAGAGSIVLSAQDFRELPLSPLAPRNMAQCNQLQSQWDALRQRVQAQHQQCLAAHSSEPSNPNSGSGPGSACSHSACQNLHTELFTILVPHEIAAVQQCRTEVAQYQQQQKTQPANANQPAALPLNLKLNQLMAQAERLSKLGNSSWPIPPAAMSSSDPNIQAKVQQIQRLDQITAQIQASKADLLKLEPDDVNTAEIAAFLSTSGIVKGLTDGTATVVALEGGPPGKALSAGYGVLTTVAGQATESAVNGGEGGGNAAASTELSAQMAEGVSSIGELFKNDPEATTVEEILGEPLEGVGNAAAMGFDAAGAYHAYAEGKYMDATADAASAIGSAAKVGGQLGEALELSGATALKNSGEGVTAAAGLAKAGQTVVTGVSDAWESFGAPGTVLQQYSSAQATETAVIQRLTGERDAAYIELLNLLLQKSDGTVTVSVPDPTPSPSPAPQNPTVTILP